MSRESAGRPARERTDRGANGKRSSRASRARAPTYTIGKLAAMSKVSTDTLRYYEREQLVQPCAKTSGGYRLYDEQTARRVRFIRHAQECGFTLSEIGDLLRLRGNGAACCDDVRRVAVERKLQLEAKIRRMRTMSVALDRLIAACNRDGIPVDACPILLGLEQSAPA